MKISMRWEDSEYTSLATPARVVQYEGKAYSTLHAAIFFVSVSRFSL
jgi:hypothetical protein